MGASTNYQLGKDISDDIGRQTRPVVGTDRVISRGRAPAGVGVVPGPGGFVNGTRQAARPGHCMARSQPSSTGGPEAEAGNGMAREAGRELLFAGPARHTVTFHAAGRGGNDEKPGLSQPNPGGRPAGPLTTPRTDGTAELDRPKQDRTSQRTAGRQAPRTAKVTSIGWQRQTANERGLTRASRPGELIRRV